MAFSLQELVFLTQTLRDVALGLLELARPQTVHQNYLRALTSVGKDYSVSNDAQKLQHWGDLFKVLPKSNAAWKYSDDTAGNLSSLFFSIKTVLFQLLNSL